jgi:Protein of unknown function (DUF2817)
LEALRADNWLCRLADGDPSVSNTIARDMRNAFYVDSEEWRQSVLHRSAQVLTNALMGLSKSG